MWCADHNDWGVAMVCAMSRLRPGWLLTLFAAALAISAWLPWLTTSVGGGGRASAIGGTFGSLEMPSRFGAGQLIALLSSVLIVLGALVGRELSPRLAAAASVVVTVPIIIMVLIFQRRIVSGLTSGAVKG